MYAKIFSLLPRMYSDSQKKFGTKTQCKIFHDGTLREGHLNSDADDDGNDDCRLVIVM